MSFIVSLSGREISLDNPLPEDFCILDIAVGLSRTARFSGQTLRGRYSVAQHSVLVSRIVESISPSHAFAGLMHDASEGYLCDVTTPVKCRLSGYSELEARFMNAIAIRFGFEWEIPYSVKMADLVALATEKRDLVPKTPTPWAILEGIHPLSEQVQPLTEKAAYYLFMDRFLELASNIGQVA